MTKQKRDEKKWKNIIIILFILLLIIFVFNIITILVPPKEISVRFTGAAVSGSAFLCIEKKPYIELIPQLDIIINQITANTNFYYRINATSRSCTAYPLLYIINNSKIAVNKDTGEINFTLTKSTYSGFHNITLTVIENCNIFPACKFNTATFLINITIDCLGEECEAEPPQPPQPPSQPSGGGEAPSGGAPGGGEVIIPPKPKPKEPCKPQVICSAWQSCIDGKKERVCEDKNMCGEFPFYLERQQCIPSTCFDGQQNGNEEEIDCGGDCKKCEEKKPEIQKPEIIKELKPTTFEKAESGISKALAFIISRINIYFIIVMLVFAAAVYAFDKYFIRKYKVNNK